MFKIIMSAAAYVQKLRAINNAASKMDKELTEKFNTMLQNRLPINSNGNPITDYPPLTKGACKALGEQERKLPKNWIVKALLKILSMDHLEGRK